MWVGIQRAEWSHSCVLQTLLESFPLLFDILVFSLRIHLIYNPSVCSTHVSSAHSFCLLFFILSLPAQCLLFAFWSDVLVPQSACMKCDWSLNLVHCVVMKCSLEMPSWAAYMSSEIKRGGKSNLLQLLRALHIYRWCKQVMHILEDVPLNIICP